MPQLYLIISCTFTRSHISFQEGKLETRKKEFFLSLSTFLGGKFNFAHSMRRQGCQVVSTHFLLESYIDFKDMNMATLIILSRVVKLFQLNFSLNYGIFT